MRRPTRRRLAILFALAAFAVATALGGWLWLSTRATPTHLPLGRSAALLVGRDRNGDRAMLALHWRERGPPSAADRRAIAIRPAGVGAALVSSGAGDRALVIHADRVAIGAAALIVGLIGAFAARRIARRAGPGRCPACGYDVRATPDRCPECGVDVVPNG